MFRSSRERKVDDVLKVGIVFVCHVGCTQTCMWRCLNVFDQLQEVVSPVALEYANDMKSNAHVHHVAIGLRLRKKCSQTCQLQLGYALQNLTLPYLTNDLD